MLTKRQNMVFHVLLGFSQCATSNLHCNSGSTATVEINGGRLKYVTVRIIYFSDTNEPHLCPILFSISSIREEPLLWVTLGTLGWVLRFCCFIHLTARNNKTIDKISGMAQCVFNPAFYSQGLVATKSKLCHGMFWSAAKKIIWTRCHLTGRGGECSFQKYTFCREFH